MNAVAALTVTSPKTRTTFAVTVHTLDVWTRTFSMRIHMSKRGFTTASATVTIAADDTMTISGNPWREGRFDAVHLGEAERAEILAGARYMWSKVRTDVLKARASKLAEKAAEALEDGNEAKAERLRAALAA